MPGKTEQTTQAGLAAKAIQEKQGVNVSVAIDRLNRMHYVINHDSWIAYGKFHETANPEFQAFMAKQGENPGSKLIRTYTGSEVTE